MKKPTFAVIAAILCWCICTPRCPAQTKEWWPDYTTVGVPHSNRNLLMQCLHERIDLSTFQNQATFKDVLNRLGEEMSKRGFELPMLVDFESFKKENARRDICTLPVSIPTRPASMTVAGFLNHVMAQLPPENGIWCLSEDCGDYIEITTKKQFANRLPTEALLKKIDMREFKAQMSLPDALQKLGAQLQVKFWMDVEAFESPRPRKDLLDMQVSFPEDDGRITLGRLLPFLLGQIPGGDATYSVHLFGLQITTQAKAHEFWWLQRREN